MNAPKMAMQPLPDEKKIKLYFTSKIPPRADAATVSFPRLRASRSEFAVSEGLVETLIIPTRQFDLSIDTTFSGSPQALRVTANVIRGNVESLRVFQEGPRGVLIDVEHTDSISTEYCTVTCEATGESRTGMGACIDCRGQKGIVRLCC
jgi:hypothetical protein